MCNMLSQWMSCNMILDGQLMITYNIYCLMIIEKSFEVFFSNEILLLQLYSPVCILADSLDVQLCVNCVTCRRVISLLLLFIHLKIRRDAILLGFSLSNFSVESRSREERIVMKMGKEQLINDNLSSAWWNYDRNECSLISLRGFHFCQLYLECFILIPFIVFLYSFSWRIERCILFRSFSLRRFFYSSVPLWMGCMK